MFGLNACQLPDNSTVDEGKISIKSKELLKPVIQRVAFNQASLGGRSIAAFMQYYSEGEASVLTYKNYNFGSRLVDPLWSKGYFTGSLKNLDNMRVLALQEGKDDVVAIALILLAHEFGALTQMFGDIPMSNALGSEAAAYPGYDSQNDVCDAVIKMLDESISILQNSSINQELSDTDLIYGGDLEKWKKLAYGLKARFLLNTRNRKNADTEILDLIDKSFSSRLDQASYTFDESFQNPNYIFGVERSGTLFLAPEFYSNLETTNDPRIQNIEVDMYDNVKPFTGKGPWFGKSSSIPLLSYTELLFMKTEVKHLAGASSAETSTLLKDAILSSMRDNDIVLVESVQAFVDAQSDLSGLDFEKIHKRVVEQARTAYYGFNYLQAWNNYRRTGYPELTSTWNMGTENNPSNIVPRRFLYPNSELTYNTANVEEAIARQGGHLLDADLWMFKK